jgi:hypothetical protein
MNARMSSYILPANQAPVDVGNIVFSGCFLRGETASVTEFLVGRSATAVVSRLSMRIAALQAAFELPPFHNVGL